MQRRHIVENFHEYHPHKENDIPEDWEVWNAARPLYGDITWQGKFLNGRFYAALNPDDPYTKDKRKRNQELDGYLITYVSRETIEKYGRAKCEEYKVDYEDFTYEQLVRSWFNSLEE